MIIFPAIDIQGGKVVRLLQGQFDHVTQYADDPGSMAQHWIQQDAQWIHCVDLDGARTGEIQNLDIILAMAQSASVPVQMGGGIRTLGDIKNLIEGGVARVVVSTKAVEDINFLTEAATTWPQKIAVSLDCKDGKVTQNGWTKTSDLSAIDFVNQLEEAGAACVIYTDISRDGMLTGPNLPALETLLKKTNLPVIASGGISSIKDIDNLKRFEAQGLIGAITGKALYEGKLDLREAIQRAE